MSSSKLSTKKIVTILLLFLLTIASVLYLTRPAYHQQKQRQMLPSNQTVAPPKPSSARSDANPSPSLPTFTPEQLAPYNGTDPQKPIYLALDGLVYDVTAGKKFYEKGGTYHHLAGRDSTKELHIAGGGIIKKKYPVVGRLEN